MSVAGKTQTRLTWCRRRRPTGSVRRWSSPSTKRDSLGTRIPRRVRKKRRRTNTWGEKRRSVALNLVVPSGWWSITRLILLVSGCYQIVCMLQVDRTHVERKAQCWFSVVSPRSTSCGPHTRPLAATSYQ